MSKYSNPQLIATAQALLAAPAGRMRLPHVLAALQISRSGLYDGISRKVLPSPQRIGKRAVAWSSVAIRSVLDGTFTAEAA